jgi:hypothetical protein
MPLAASFIHVVGFVYVPVVPPPLPFWEISQTTEHREWALPTLWRDPFPRLLVHHLNFIVKGFCWATAGAAAAWETPSNPEFSSPKPGKTKVLL